MKQIICRFFSAAILFSMIVTSSAFATIFNDRSLFEASISINFIENFETLGPATAVFSGPITMPTGLVVSSPSNELFTVGIMQSTNPTTAIGSNTPSTDYLDFNLGSDYAAFGADFFQNFGGGSQGSEAVDYQLQFFNDSILIDTIVGSVAPNGGSFIGYISTLGAFDQVQALSLADSFEVVDNVTVGDASVVPEPTTILLLGFGLLGLLGVKRKFQY